MRGDEFLSDIHNRKKLLLSIYKSVGRELDIEPEVIESIFLHQFKFVRKKLTEGHNIRLLKFGMFAIRQNISPKYKEYVTNKKQKDDLIIEQLKNKENESL